MLNLFLKRLRLGYKRIYLFVVILSFPAMESDDLFKKCGWSIGGSENRTCPEYESPWWICLAEKKNCTGKDVYHCCRDTYGNWRDICDEEKICLAGQEPQIVNDGVRCNFCQNPERYNPLSFNSSQYSECPFKKTNCAVKKMVECLEKYNSDDPHLTYKIDRICRCDHEQNMAPSFNDSIITSCKTASELDCRKKTCDTLEGRTQTLGADYKCHPHLNSTTAAMTAVANSTNTTKSMSLDRTSTTTPLYKTPTVPKPRDTNRTIDNNPIDGKIVAAVVGSCVGILIIGAIVFCCFYFRRSIQAKPPRTLQIESITSSEVDLMWSPPDIRQGHLPTHYKLYQQVIGLNGQAGKWVKTKQIEAENTTYRVRNLTLGTDYRFRVRAVYRFIGCIGWTVQSKPLDSTQLVNMSERNTEQEASISAPTVNMSERNTEQEASISAPTVNMSERNTEQEASISAPTVYMPERNAEQEALISAPTEYSGDNDAETTVGAEGVTENGYDREEEAKYVWERVISKNIRVLKRRLAENTIDYIIEDDLGNPEQRTRIKEAGSSIDRNQQILELIDKQGFSGYKIFKRILGRSGQKDLLDQLKKTEHILLKERKNRKEHFDGVRYDASDEEVQSLI